MNMEEYKKLAVGDKVINTRSGQKYEVVFKSDFSIVIGSYNSLDAWYELPYIRPNFLPDYKVVSKTKKIWKNIYFEPFKGVYFGSCSYGSRNEAVESISKFKTTHIDTIELIIPA